MTIERSIDRRCLGEDPLDRLARTDPPGLPILDTAEMFEGMGGKWRIVRDQRSARMVVDWVNFLERAEMGADNIASITGAIRDGESFHVDLFSLEAWEWAKTLSGRRTFEETKDMITGARRAFAHLLPKRTREKIGVSQSMMRGDRRKARQLVDSCEKALPLLDAVSQRRSRIGRI